MHSFFESSRNLTRRSSGRAPASLVLPTQDGARKPLLPGRTASTVRRVSDVATASNAGSNPDTTLPVRMCRGQRLSSRVRRVCPGTHRRRNYGEASARPAARLCSGIRTRGTGSPSPWGAFDTPTSTHIEKHIFVAEKGDYYEINDDLPQNLRYCGSPRRRRPHSTPVSCGCCKGRGAPCGPPAAANRGER